MRKELAFGVVVLGFASQCCGSAQELRESISGLEAYCSTSQFSTIGSVEEWGFSSRDYNAMPFVAAVAAVSNHWQDAIADWGYYSTNGNARLLFRLLTGFAGTNALVGVLDGMLDIAETNQMKCPPTWFHKQIIPNSAPLERFVERNYSIPVVSNCMWRASLVYSNDLQLCGFLQKILSGFRKETLEDIDSVEQIDWSK